MFANGRGAIQRALKFHCDFGAGAELPPRCFLLVRLPFCLTMVFFVFVWCFWVSHFFFGLSFYTVYIFNKIIKNIKELEKSRLIGLV